MLCPSFTIDCFAFVTCTTCQLINTHTIAYTFSNTIPLACEAPPNGLAFQRVPK